MRRRGRGRVVAAAAEVLAEVREDDSWVVADRLVLDASAWTSLGRSFVGVQLAKWLEPLVVHVWTVEHFHPEVAEVFRRDVLAGDLDDVEATELVTGLAGWPLHVVRVAPLLTVAWEL